MPDLKTALMPRVKNALELMAGGTYLSADPNEQLGRIVAVLVLHNGDEVGVCTACGQMSPCPTVNAILYGGGKEPQ